ncbi:hypothetical protein [Brevibacillus sp. FSL K6-2834]|uniref:hypothetical protein n=1 Tax=Brevibacillus sp. FSL K6-2834 TaxID=2954680 RepID=UPI0031586B4F
MAIKEKTFSAFQIDLHYISTRKQVQYDSTKWDGQIFGDMLNRIYHLQETDKTLKFKDSWLMYLDYLEVDEHVIFGRFSSAGYGTNGALVHADTLQKRPNPKNIREGEEQYTYFLIRKTDGLLLLQGHIQLNRGKVQEYFERLGRPDLVLHNLTGINVCTLVDNDFFENIKALTSVDNIFVEITSKEESDENSAVKLMQKQVDKLKATHIKLDFRAKYSRKGLSNVIPFINEYKDKKGVTSIVVKGKLGLAEKSINLKESSEKYKRRIEVDRSNQPMIESVKTALVDVAGKRAALRR